jgi:hypothetical protein
VRRAAFLHLARQREELCGASGVLMHMERARMKQVTGGTAPMP